MNSQTPNTNPQLGDYPVVAHPTNTGRMHPVMDNLDQTLRQLIAEVCQEPPLSCQRQNKLCEIYQLVMESGKLWQESTPYYHDALQQMWEYCCQHPQDYDPTVKEVITWLNDELKKRLRRLREAKYRQRQRQISALLTAQEQTIDSWDNCPANPDIEPVLEIWQETLDWVRDDPDQVLQNTCFRGRADINCQVLFLLRFPAETPWSTIAAKFNLTPAEAKDLPKFYNRRCKPILREFGISQGYIEAEQNPEPER